MRCPHCGSRGIAEVIGQNAFYIALTVLCLIGRLGKTCSRCSAAIVTPEQAERGLCAMCLTGASLSALVGLAASHRLDAVSSGEVGKVTFETQAVFQPPIYFGHQRTDSEWKRDTFPQETQ